MIFRKHLVEFPVLIIDWIMNICRGVFSKINAKVCGVYDVGHVCLDLVC